MIDSLFTQANYVASKQMMDATALRQEGIAANLANVETPGYKRVDLPKDFTKDFAAHLQAGQPAETSRPVLTADTHAVAQRKDGNTVQLDKELLAMNRNTAEFDVLTELVSGSLKQLRLAVTGRNV